MKNLRSWCRGLALCAFVAASGPTVISNAQTSSVIVPNYSATNQPHNADASFREILRQQAVYSASEFPPYPIVISQIRWRPDLDAGGPLSTIISNLQVHVSTTQGSPDNLNSTFAQNVGTNETLVF